MLPRSFFRFCFAKAQCSGGVRLLTFFSLIFILNACVIPFAVREYHIGYREVGLASWYGTDFHGRPTASGEIYNMFEISAAHKSLPLGTLLMVTDIKTGKQVKVKVNDRGPFVRDRILDLSYGAARQLGIVGEGVAEIELKVVGRAPIYLPDTKEEKHFFVQIGSFQVKENALRMKETADSHYQNVTVNPVESVNGRMYRVRLGPYLSEQEARLIVGKIRSERVLNGTLRPIVTAK